MHFPGACQGYHNLRAAAGENGSSARVARKIPRNKSTSERCGPAKGCYSSKAEMALNKAIAGVPCELASGSAWPAWPAGALGTRRDRLCEPRLALDLARPVLGLGVDLFGIDLQHLAVFGNNGFSQTTAPKRKSRS
jgi:hypothetical protein